jgi:hypothetical protein
MAQKMAGPFVDGAIKDRRLHRYLLLAFCGAKPLNFSKSWEWMKKMLRNELFEFVHKIDRPCQDSQTRALGFFFNKPSPSPTFS